MNNVGIFAPSSKENWHAFGPAHTIQHDVRDYDKGNGGEEHLSFEEWENWGVSINLKIPSAAFQTGIAS